MLKKLETGNYPIEDALEGFIRKAGDFFFPKKPNMIHLLEILSWLGLTLAIILRITGWR